MTINDVVNKNGSLNYATIGGFKDRLDGHDSSLADLTNLGDVTELNADILVKTQTDANNLLTNLKAISKSTINIAFFEGNFYIDALLLDNTFNGKTLNFYNITSKNVTIYPKSDIYTPSDSTSSTNTHYICPLKNPYIGNDSIITDKGQIKVCDTKKTNSTSGINYNAQLSVDTYDSTNKIYRVKIPTELQFFANSTSYSNSRLYLYSWFLMYGNTITNVDNTYIYFKAPYSSSSAGSYVDGDHNFLVKPARFYITNVASCLDSNTFMVSGGNIYIPKKCKYAILANSLNSFYINNCGATINISGLSFSGGLYNPTNDNNDGAIRINNSQNITIQYCNFQDIDGNAVFCISDGNGNGTPYVTNNININSNTFTNIGCQAVFAYGQNINVNDNVVKGGGVIKRSANGLSAGGKNFNILRNKVSNFSYCGINMIALSSDNTYYQSGSISYNILQCDPNRNVEVETVADGGAIYSYVSSNSLTISYNVVFNIYGHVYRGIMGDGGMDNTTYLNNLVFNIEGATIDTVNTMTGFTNYQNNIIQNNICIGNAMKIGSSATSNTTINANLVNQMPSYGNGMIVTNPDIITFTPTSDSENVYIPSSVQLPFTIPTFFNQYIKYSKPFVSEGDLRNKYPLYMSGKRNKLDYISNPASVGAIRRCGVLAMNGKIYANSRGSSDILCIDPAKNSASVAYNNPGWAGTSKFDGIVSAPNGLLYLIPSRSTTLTVFDPFTNTSTDIINGLSTVSNTDNWSGGVLTPEGKIYCPPASSSQTKILVIDTWKNSVYYIDTTSLSLTTTVFRSGVYAPNGKIYFVNFSGTNVLVLDTSNDSMYKLSISDSGSAFWGGVVGQNGKIYFIPNYAGEIGVIDPSTDAITYITGADTANRPSYQGGVLAPDGKIYCPPYNSTKMLVIDPVAGTKDETTYTGFTANGSSYSGAVLAPNGKIYCIPENSNQIMVINPGFPTIPINPLLSPLYNKSY